jgi:hypothetical protein
MQKTSYYIVSHLAMIVHAIAAKFHATMDNLVPVGYQDESGFHTGVKRSSSGETWPPVD